MIIVVLVPLKLADIKSSPAPAGMKMAWMKERVMIGEEEEVDMVNYLLIKNIQ